VVTLKLGKTIWAERKNQEGFPGSGVATPMGKDLSAISALEYATSDEERLRGIQRTASPDCLCQYKERKRLGSTAISKWMRSLAMVQPRNRIGRRHFPMW
jgi:hypothetical protein